LESLSLFGFPLKPIKFILAYARSKLDGFFCSLIYLITSKNNFLLQYKCDIISTEIYRCEGRMLYAAHIPGSENYDQAAGID
jgi:hypothetical protein